MREINCETSNIIKFLSLENNFEIDCCNNQLSTRARKLEKDINDCHQSIGELFEENTTLWELTTELLVDCDCKSSYNNESINDATSESAIDEREKLKEFLGNFRKGFLINCKRGDRRKKLHDEIDIL